MDRVPNVDAEPVCPRPQHEQSRWAGFGLGACLFSLTHPSPRRASRGGGRPGPRPGERKHVARPCVRRRVARCRSTVGSFLGPRQSRARLDRPSGTEKASAHPYPSRASRDIYRHRRLFCSVRNHSLARRATLLFCVPVSSVRLDRHHPIDVQVQPHVRWPPSVRRIGGIVPTAELHVVPLAPPAHRSQERKPQERKMGVYGTEE